MKTTLLKLMMAAAVSVFCANLHAQTVSDFENLTLSTDSFWNGSTVPMGASFNSGNAFFPNFYDTSFGGYWKTGWAYSRMKDTSTAGYTNLYSAMPGSGYGGSANFVIGQQSAIVKVNGIASGKIVDGFYATNGTYPYYSMKDGDGFAKKFGGVSGNDTDWFKLSVRKYYQGTLGSDSVQFYLADYRFTNNAQDYIVKTWEWVNLTSLGNADSLLFTISSTDTGAFGMNNPPFFFMDNFTTSNSGVGIASINKTSVIAVYPNPSHDCIFVEAANASSTDLKISVTDMNGKQVYTSKFEGALKLDVSGLEQGLYFIHISGTNFSEAQKFIKQ